MGTTELRQSIHRIIEQADERFLRMINSLAAEYAKEDTTVAYRAGTAITKAELHQELKEAEEEIERGGGMTIEDFAKASSKWD
ncbi:hypothetical protein [Geofilum rhodophaeum]|uniref:hypothetical protein n=1 Tax=Geofilum rhodophaeum TaxID=1965019 RepID=UPI000B52700A|nr:hypothetical protein [Geofilum rhodophaeum]